MNKIKAFNRPIYVTRPLLPDLKEVFQQLEEVWDSKWLTNGGPKHKKLEDKLRKLLKVPQIALFNNGTVALLMACKALDLKGEVITTPFTFPATIHVLDWLGITPVFCDVDPVNMTIDPKKIESLITPKTSGILGVHIFGMPCDVFSIQEIALRQKLKVVYDAAHAFQTEINHVGIGNFGDASALSFHATKLFHTAEGGAVVCKSQELIEKINLLKNFGNKNETEVVLSGLNGKMNELQAVLGLVNLNYLQQERENRKKILEVYTSLLSEIPGLTFVRFPKDITNSYQYFVVRINERKFGISRNKVYEKLKDYNVYSRRYFYPLCSNYHFYKHLKSAAKSMLPIANVVSNEVLSLPFYGSLGINEVEIICELIKSVH